MYARSQACSVAQYQPANRHALSVILTILNLEQLLCLQGKVPRNEYGNVELFKPSMLPAGACHIQGTRRNVVLV